MLKKALLPLFALFTLSNYVLGNGLVNDHTVTIESPLDVEVRRQELVSYVWGGKGLPLSQLPKLPVIKNDISPINGLVDLERVDTLVVEMEADVKSYAHHFIPIVKNNRLVVFLAGHLHTFNDSEIPADIGYGMRRTIEGLLGDGYSVLAVYMPRNVEFSTSIEVSDPGGIDAHNELFNDPSFHPKTGSPIKYFLEPVTVLLNYLSSRSAPDNFPIYKDFSMVGFSGGGWAATVYPAIDTRIGLSVSVAGSIPLYLRTGAAIGDAEQTDTGFYSIAGYPDLYVMASYGTGRKNIQIMNRHDWCCFGEYHHDLELSGGLSYDESIRDYESRVRNALLKLGETELFSVEIDEAAPGHNVTWDAIYDTILPELNEGKRAVGTFSGSEIAARNKNKRPAVFLNGIWSPSKLSPMSGLPAILRGSINIYDMFYRTESNQLVHVSRPPLIWSRAKVLANDIISDPAAVSRSAGSYDVVALDEDYRLLHINRTGNEVSTAFVDKDIRGLGPPVLLVSSPDRLELFFRGWNRKLFHASKEGSQPWHVQEVGGRMADFPTAVAMPDGSLRAFVRGLDNELWEVRKDAGSGQDWGPWTSVSQISGGGPISGTPSAALINNTVNVFVRTPESMLRRYSMVGNTWNTTLLPGRYIGSPTASPKGTYARSIGGTLFFLNSSGWVQIDGVID